MKKITAGNFFGNTDQTIILNEIIITNTEYTHEFVDWHYHDNAYFTFLLAGNVSEISKTDHHKCVPGTLLFHNSHDPHYNVKPKGYTRGMQLELSSGLLSEFAGKKMDRGSFEVVNPLVKSLFHQMLLLSKNPDETSLLSLHSLALNAIDGLCNHSNPLIHKHPPEWVNKIRQLLHDNVNKSHSLASLSNIIGIHPVHLSRYFPKYFGCNLGAYIRRMRLCKAAAEFGTKKKSAIQIAFECGFYDQAHLIRCFKEEFRFTPHQYQRYLKQEL
ncbi:helix-turn-helix domain-containing protein [Pedobacter kyonggii]|uniref:AraC family transcriptional regulator n=1 Tax=Pedobacter kyonggii TaxID=1926871 RepID=A0A4Q9H967_9SPHI|nr:AraC family transcriptional regulator [Pedobacter kyonggii]TBO40431.1 AraC family transcriptional regulator [Pedobacter kyonggii]